jgi:hypothetical protein
MIDTMTREHHLLLSPKSGGEEESEAIPGNPLTNNYILIYV